MTGPISFSSSYPISVGTHHMRTADRNQDALDQWLAGVGDMGEQSEDEMIGAMWPGREQPITATPRGIVTASESVRYMELASAPQGASIGYRIFALMADEGIGSGLVRRMPGRQPGLYMIANSADGERTFRYWRSESPARELFADDDSTAPVEMGLADCGMIYLSGISLAILSDQGRGNLFAMLARFRHKGGYIAFDSNYRPRLWRSEAQVREAVRQALELSHMALLTLEDEQALWNLDSVEQVLAMHGHNELELVVKQGSRPVIICCGQNVTQTPVAPVSGIVDTTGAGDAFNGGYLAARLRGEPPANAVAMANRAAAAVICRRGGIVGKEYFMTAMGAPGLSA